MERRKGWRMLLMRWMASSSWAAREPPALGSPARNLTALKRPPGASHFQTSPKPPPPRGSMRRYPGIGSAPARGRVVPAPAHRSHPEGPRARSFRVPDESDVQVIRAERRDAAGAHAKVVHAVATVQSIPSGRMACAGRRTVRELVQAATKGDHAPGRLLRSAASPEDASASTTPSQRAAVNGTAAPTGGGSGTNQAASAAHSPDSPAPVRAETATAPSAPAGSITIGRSILLIISRTDLRLGAGPDRRRRGVEHPKAQVRVGRRRPRGPHALRFQRVRPLAQPGRVRQFHRPAVDGQPRRHHVARRPRRRRHDAALVAGQGVDEAALADVGRPGHGHAPGSRQPAAQRRPPHQRPSSADAASHVAAFAAPPPRSPGRRRRRRDTGRGGSPPCGPLARGRGRRPRPRRLFRVGEGNKLPPVADLHATRLQQVEHEANRRPAAVAVQFQPRRRPHSPDGQHGFVGDLDAQPAHEETARTWIGGRFGAGACTEQRPNRLPGSPARPRPRRRRPPGRAASGKRRRWGRSSSRILDPAPSGGARGCQRPGETHGHVRAPCGPRLAAVRSRNRTQVLIYYAGGISFSAAQRNILHSRVANTPLLASGSTRPREWSVPARGAKRPGAPEECSFALSASWPWGCWTRVVVAAAAPWAAGAAGSAWGLVQAAHRGPAV